MELAATEHGRRLGWTIRDQAGSKEAATGRARDAYSGDCARGFQTRENPKSSKCLLLAVASSLTP
jgi:hypothetical protein